MGKDRSGEGPPAPPGRPAGELVAELVSALAAADRTVATAESLTGGLLGGAITDVPGASRVYRGGVVAYATAVKQSVLGVSEDLVAAHGVVSGECAGAMARGVRDLLTASYGVATTGVAGPDPQEGHAAGTVWIAVAGPGTTATRLLALSGDRAAVRAQTCAAAVDLLSDVLQREVLTLG
jgi:nicotinamide-nucleotide amidase